MVNSLDLPGRRDHAKDDRRFGTVPDKEKAAFEGGLFFVQIRWGKKGLNNLLRLTSIVSTSETKQSSFGA